MTLYQENRKLKREMQDFKAFYMNRVTLAFEELTKAKDRAIAAEALLADNQEAMKELELRRQAFIFLESRPWYINNRHELHEYMKGIIN